MNRLLLIGAAAMPLVPMGASADAYQFIISGDPVAAATEGCRVVASSGTSLETGRLATTTAADSLEARYRTWYESDGTALRSDRPRGMTICIR
ncbi:MAG: hypothetical protein IKE55_06075 [Kiritimatiellae bacterium]|nr:hypothetical protein [Kiritimatiellia bacterium]